tara:strand:- start:1820 stop:2050 length:231 start_codon:yes stop_codon:yes gene_type:complete
MGLIQGNPTILFFIVFSLGIFFVTSILLFSKKNQFNLRKEKPDKVLLKELLESFGLDVPSELNECRSEIVKTIKGS